MSLTCITDLPEEMMVKIFSLLPPQDIMLVCKSWSEIGEDPTLWVWSVLIVNSREDFYKLDIRRFQLIQMKTASGLKRIGLTCLKCWSTFMHWPGYQLVAFGVAALSFPSFVKPGKRLSVITRLEEIQLYMQFSSLNGSLMQLQRTIIGIRFSWFMIVSTTTLSLGFLHLLLAM